MHSFGLPKANGSIRRPTRSVAKPGEGSFANVGHPGHLHPYYAVLTHGILSFRCA
jgi:hypothetical protein